MLARCRSVRGGATSSLSPKRTADAPSPVPLFLGLNFFGNHTILLDPAIHLNTNWMQASDQNGIVDNKATVDSRGCLAHRWAVETVIDRVRALVEEGKSRQEVVTAQPSAEFDERWGGFDFVGPEDFVGAVYASLTGE